MANISPKNRDTRYPLWYVLYQVRVPFIQTLSLEELEEYGLPTSGDKHHDHAMLWEPKLISIPIHRMVDLWSSKANISLVNRSDSVKIYEAIARHLNAWRNFIEDSVHPTTPPTEDLLAMDAFASTIYDHAKVIYDTTFVKTYLKINSSSAIGRRAMLEDMRVSDERRETAKEKGQLELRNTEYYPSVPRYDAKAVRPFVDYSGTVKKVDAPKRESMATFFKKAKR